MKNAYIAYYTHIAQLKQYANKHTVFMAHMLSMMVFDESTKQLVVSLNPRIKRMIIKEINSTSNNPLGLANQYLNKLKKSGAIKPIGGGDYLVDPENYGYAKYVPKILRMKSKAVYCSYVFTDDGIKEKQGVILDDGREIETGVISDVGGDDSFFIDSDGVRVDL